VGGPFGGWTGALEHVVRKIRVGTDYGSCWASLGHILGVKGNVAILGRLGPKCTNPTTATPICVSVHRLVDNLT